MERAAGYLRVSKAREEMHSSEIYLEQIERFCTYQGLDLLKVYEDIDISAYKGQHRPGLQALVDDRLRYKTIVIPRLSRFGRSVKELVRLFDVFDSDRIRLVFLDMNIDSSTSQGRLLRNVMACFSEYESDVKSDYMRANHRHLRSLGQPWGGRPPFGYEKHPTERTFLILDERAAIIREIFDSYLRGESQYAISVRLNEEGRVRPSGASWRGSMIGRLLDNPAYAALCIVDDGMVPAVWEPIISKELWDDVRKKRIEDVHRYKQIREIKKGPYLLTGLLRCGYCGGRLNHRAKPKTKDGIYLCVIRGGKKCPGGSVDGSWAEHHVGEQFLARWKFIVPDEPGPEDPRERWAHLSLSARRALLYQAIEKIEVVAWPGGANPQRDAGKRRELVIHWGSGVRPVPEIVRARENRYVSNGRAEMMREVEVARRKAQTRLRSERARASHQEWARYRRGLVAPSPPDASGDD